MLKDIPEINKNYSEFLKGKKVVLVGPAYHTKNTLQKKLIHSYDIVVRMNFGFATNSPKVERDIGDKINIWYSSLSLHFFDPHVLTYKEIRSMRKRGLKWMAHACSHHSYGEQQLRKINKDDIPIHRVDSSHFNFLQSKIGNKVSVGLLTIYDLLQFKIKELYITGMSFFDTSVINKRRTYHTTYHSPKCGLKGLNYIDIQKSNHNFKKELKYFAKLYKFDKRISCDKVLKKTLKLKIGVK